MTEQDNNKANAAILLSADEAVEKKILDVLRKNPEVVAWAVAEMDAHKSSMSQRYTQHLAQSMGQTAQQVAANQLQGVFTSNMTAGNVFPKIYGGKK
jgi:hypothetical protein